MTCQRSIGQGESESHEGLHLRRIENAVVILAYGMSCMHTTREAHVRQMSLKDAFMDRMMHTCDLKTARKTQEECIRCQSELFSQCRHRQ